MTTVQCWILQGIGCLDFIALRPHFKPALQLVDTIMWTVALVFIIIHVRFHCFITWCVHCCHGIWPILWWILCYHPLCSYSDTCLIRNSYPERVHTRRKQLASYTHDGWNVSVLPSNHAVLRNTFASFCTLFLSFSLFILYIYSLFDIHLQLGHDLQWNSLRNSVAVRRIPM